MNHFHHVVISLAAVLGTSSAIPMLPQRWVDEINLEYVEKQELL
jgi:hypothetical protein